MKFLYAHIKLPFLLVMLLFSLQTTAQQVPDTYVFVVLKGGSLPEVLQQLSKETSTSFTYNPAVLSRFQIGARKYSKVTVTSIVADLLKETGYDYKYNGKGFIIFPKNKHHALPDAVLQAYGTVAVPGLFTGLIVDEKNKPLSFASVKLEETQDQQTSDVNGSFSFKIPDTRQVAHLTISYMGKQTREVLLTAADYKQTPTYMLKELSLTLEGIHVNAVQKGTNSNSSIVFDREAIEQSQAFSLADLLSALPGREVKAPDLKNVQTLTLRTASTDVASNLNALGVTYIVDGIAQSNDANMQSKSLSMFGLSTSMIRPYGERGFDVPFTGFDMRDIPVNNIERIEIVSGVPSAKIGNATTGAVIIDRQAGYSPWAVNVGINGYTTQYSMGKGFDLGKKLGALNIAVNHLRYNADPRNMLQSYDRTNLSVMWTDYLTSKLKNTVAVSYVYRNDNLRSDPEDDREQAVYAKTNNISFTNRMSYEVNSSFLRRVSLNLGYSHARQESYSQYLINAQPKAIADKDTTGIYEGYYIPGNYTAIDHVLGQPNNGSADLSAEGAWLSGNIEHTWSIGWNTTISYNNGEGVIVDPAAPRFVNQSYQNQRPYAYEFLPALINSGFYIQDHFNVFLGDKKLTLDPGLRYDIQNGFGTLQPRINTSLTLNRHFTTTLGFGTSSRAPGMAYRYPAPSYFDIPVLLVYDQQPEKRLVLMYTEKVTPDNSYLRPIRSTQVEWGWKYSDKKIATSLFFYYRNMRGGFNTTADQKMYSLPGYDYDTIGGKIHYYPNGKSKNVTGMALSRVVNDVNTDDIGADWLLSVGRIKPIATTFSFSAGMAYSKYGSHLNRIYLETSSLAVSNNVWYGLFSPVNYEAWAFNGRINASTHIPKLGFIVNLTTNLSLYKRQRNFNNSNRFLGYTDLDNIYHPAEELSPDSPIFRLWSSLDTSAYDNAEPFYFTFNMQVVKEIKKKIRFSVNAYNVFNLLNQKYYDKTNLVKTFSQPVVLSGEIALKF
ncbi:carboxypeptidase-like regulatory domain-containing protein [Chitinophaga sp. Cy-1792]|uniref:TonB-dependent receptor n=1 Tax=Chitinophaga sp. Cy-1792 TaxID=2608339 RepID=UPI0014213526|nr:carboxypeptidase-like regulatory domain-containing protein [Chitinophaga sp. Cy-1792]NIG54378.1 TonB-dependent receptor [Chitinophaga sp. Cy-1792]